MPADTFRVVEVFKSIQGEGHHVGAPSIFVRFFLCNLQCAGFGMPEGEKSTERDEIAKNIEQFKTLADVPLARTGCDSFVAWDKRFRHLSSKMTADDLIAEILRVHGSDDLGDTHLVFTGGEPLLQFKTVYGRERMIHLLARLSEDHGLKHVTFETNGTIPLSAQMLVGGYETIHFTMSVSPKMRASGEPRSKAWNYAALKSFYTVGDRQDPMTTTVFKFVVKDEVDVKEVESFLFDFPFIDRSMVYLMPVGGCQEEYQENARPVAELALRRGFKYSPRLHVDLWGNSWAT